MAIKRWRQKVLLRPEDIKPSKPQLRVVGVFNPGAVRFNDKIYLLARVAEGAVEEAPGFWSSPRLTEKGEIQIDRLPIKNQNNHKMGGSSPREFSRLPFISHLRLIELDSSGFNVNFIDPAPTFYPREFYEEFGVEDPRITFIQDRFYITYVAVSSTMGVCTALASTRDFREFQRWGIIFATENKDVVILPEKFQRENEKGTQDIMNPRGGYCAYHRPVSRMDFNPPNIQTAYSPDLIHWGEHGLLLTPREGMWDDIRIGAGTVPVKLKEGWLEIYHGVKKKSLEDPVGVYCAGAVLTDLKDPCRVIARCGEPLLEPVTETESRGFVPHVVFPTGAVTDETGENLLLFCGGGDRVVEVIMVSIADILQSLE